MNKQLITISFLATVALGAYASEEYYKWIDERGVTHYSETPPDDTGKFKSQVISVSTRLPMGSEAAVSNLEKQRSDAAKEKTQGKEGVTKVGKKADVSNAPDQYKEKCTQLKADLQTLSDKAGRIKIQDAKGEVHTMTEEERTQRIDENQRQIKAFCEK
jgi:hypothetical protein